MDDLGLGWVVVGWVTDSWCLWGLGLVYGDYWGVRSLDVGYFI